MKNNNNKIQKAYFAGGCFWGVEYYFQNLSGVISTKVGYMGGHKKNPTYEDVSAQKTGHAETLEVTFDSLLVNYVDLAKLFFEIHDPTELNRQGPDIGAQYRSAIFYVDDEQRAIAEELIRLLKEKGYAVVTKLEKAGTFWEAEDYHQKYYAQNGHEPYCHIRQKKF
jgi:peptide methionine sulfoxide reductase msrA/msrB